jgi:hypothetical protein
VPPDVLEDRIELLDWARRAIQVAIAHAQKSRRRVKKSGPTG